MNMTKTTTISIRSKKYPNETSRTVTRKGKFVRSFIFTPRDTVSRTAAPDKINPEMPIAALDAAPTREAGTICCINTRHTTNSPKGNVISVGKMEDATGISPSPSTGFK
ncbi:hypothetical protein D3C76_1137090 [compost metagenome]